MIEDRYFNRDEKKHFSRNETFHDASVDSITKSCGTAVKEKVGSVESNKETNKIHPASNQKQC